jgi:protein SCO1
VRTPWACVAVVCAALIAGYALTDGYNAFTSEQARRLAVERAPRDLPPIVLTDAFGRPFSLSELAAEGRKMVLLDFFFSRCESVCSVLGAQFQRLQNQIIERGLQHRIALLSVSFDPSHDTPRALTVYSRRLGADPNIWRFAAVPVGDLQATLQAFDVVVIADPIAIYQHNAAIHLIDTQGKLARIIDYAAPGDALDAALSLQTASSAQVPSAP